ncbi:HU family DNA-binding protein [Syntrophothermus lipocalidus]|uniref:Histone family protein DNA-binding protein n=1 Tax=Syntrophothermus lipocalidus (strain DSM 12680 / TGB-C1) TaxID=643648 RepID=D7CQ06_SYNLT|nr:HU family DNA-binding protein [Syntrophothermus lipocalidus]ADI02784.1 histone family protein DNA-binding protein [Syntrophothermus lipocalidus DSM 12680]
MNRKAIGGDELVKRIADKTGLLQKDVRAVLRAFEQVVKDALTDGYEVRLVGFGTFRTRRRAARKGQIGGRAYEIPETVVPVFAPGKGLKEAVGGETAKQG